MTVFFVSFILLLVCNQSRKIDYNEIKGTISSKICRGYCERIHEDALWSCCNKHDPRNEGFSDPSSLQSKGIRYFIVVMFLLMGDYRTKEDDVAKISTSVYVTNFPKYTSAKELAQACKQYGHVIDTFIPNKKSKVGKRFGFIRFINVFSEERLINNLSTVWIDRFRIHANIARFQRPKGKNEEKKSFPGPSFTTKVLGKSGDDRSFKGVLNGDKSALTEVKNNEPLIVLGDECLRNKNIYNALFGRVNEFASLANLKKALGNEGFLDITIKYMGELWVMLEFRSA
ncbi:nucleotide-binding alpha-beta plait domain-containing protein [Tanacetum coccineum]